MQPAILVTGAPRSGTTIVGKMLCVPRHMAYIDEPFNYQTGLSGIKQPFVYLGRDTQADNEYYENLMNLLLRGRANFHAPNLPGADQHPIKIAGRKLFHSRTQLKYQRDVLNPLRTRFLIKDPMACLAAGQLHRDLGLKTVVVIRHPASTIASYMRLRWEYKLTDLTCQPELMASHLDPILKGVDLEKLSQVQAWSYLWLCLYTVLDAHLQADPSIYSVIFRDLSTDPQTHFRDMYDYCDLPWSTRATKQIERHTAATNPTDPGVGVAHALKRNSLGNIHRWKKMLEPDEISEIRRITEPLASKYFSDADW